MIYLILFFIGLWAIFLASVLLAQKCMRSLDDFRNEKALSLPKISIIIAIKDGEKELGEALTRLMNFNYPTYEVIIVNDRSRDKTREIIQKFESDYPHLIGIHIKELPSKWLGKVHALHQGVQLATGDYLLFMDADIIIDEEVLLNSIKACEHFDLDHLGVLPNFIPGEYLLNVMTATSTLLFTVSARPWLDIAKRPLESTKGVGAYNFIKRSSLLKTEGFEWLKMDVADDVALAQLIAKSGGRSLLMKAGEKGPTLHWYNSFKELVYGLEKNIVGGFTNYKLSLVIFMSFFSILTIVIPLFALIFYTKMTIFFLFPTLIFTLSVRKFMKQSPIVIFSFPLGIALLGIILMRSSFICFKNGGIKWSGTFYSLKDLREGTRVKLGF